MSARTLAAALGLGLTAYAVALVATMPAAAVSLVVEPPAVVTRLSGTVWDGEARLGARHALAWRVRPWASLGARAGVIDWSLTAADTRLSGRARVTGGAIETDAAGAAGWSLVALALGETGIGCEQGASVRRLEVLAAGGERRAAGLLESAPGVCRGGGRTVEVPALAARIATDAEGVRAVVARRDRPDAALGEARLARDGRLVLRVEPAGARLVPGMPSAGASVIEWPTALKALPPPAR